MKISHFGFAVACWPCAIGGGRRLLAGPRQAKHEGSASSARRTRRKVLYCYDPMQPEQRFDKPASHLSWIFGASP